jgi:hypothetical protein
MVVVINIKVPPELFHDGFCFQVSNTTSAIIMLPLQPPHYEVRIRFRPPPPSLFPSNDRFLEGGGFEPNGRLFFSFCPIFFCFFSIAFRTARFPPSVASASYLALTSNFRLSAIAQHNSISVRAMAKNI